MVTEATTRRRATLSTALGVLAALYAITFFLGALLHLGVRVSLGFAVLAEPRILPATIVVEGLCRLFLAVGAYATLTRKTRAWTARSPPPMPSRWEASCSAWRRWPWAGPSTGLNDIYHRVMLAALAAGLVLLLTPVGRAALGRGDRGSR